LEDAFGSTGVTKDDVVSPAPSVIGEHYVVDRELGRGGMAIVYLCTDRRDGSRVAVKVLRHELESGVVTERFLREIAFASELDHPRIPKVLDTGMMGELPYYVMTYVEGESLKARLEREKQLPLDDAIRIVCDVIAPTAYAHKRGIVHRDIKPDNILLAADGVYVLDFGIARAIIESGVDRLTSTGIGVGTPAYMSPEQALGDRNLDARSDIYSLGCVLYEMIAGIPPFVGPTAQVIISRRFAAAPPPLKEVRDGVPEPVEAVISRALARSPADRWPTAAAFGEALQASATYVKPRAATFAFRRSSVVRATLGIVFIALVALGILAWSLAHRNQLQKAQDSLRSWDLNAAATQLRQAVTANPRDPNAKLWLAQVLMLLGAPDGDWKESALFAGDHRAELAPDDRLRADALVALSSGKYADACGLLDSLNRLQQKTGSTDYTATLALAECLRGDSAILADAASPSGFRFRASYQSAASLYEGLLDRNANNPSAYSLVVPRLKRVLVTDKAAIRPGVLRGRQTQQFYAQPSLASDTLAYIPSAPEPSGAWLTRDPNGLVAAVTRNRQRLRLIAVKWSRIAPDDPNAHETLERILESTGELDGSEISAQQALNIARRVAAKGAGGAEQRYLRELRLGTAQVRLYLKGKHFDLAGIFADSVLRWEESAQVDDSTKAAADTMVTSLAGLLGRASRVIELQRRFDATAQQARLSTGEIVTLPPQYGTESIKLLNYAAFGGPGDSVRAAVTRLTTGLGGSVPTKQLREWRTGVLIRALGLAAPVIGPEAVAELGTTSYPFIRALTAFAHRDHNGARRLLDSVAAIHGDFAPGEITMDVVFEQAWLRSALGDPAGAARDLDAALEGLPASSTILDNPIFAASLVRAMALRAELAGRAGQRDISRTWANAVFALWGKGDYITASTVERVRQFR
jgi:serine/threonine protein kinase